MGVKINIDELQIGRNAPRVLRTDLPLTTDLFAHPDKWYEDHPESDPTLQRAGWDCDCGEVHDPRIVCDVAFERMSERSQELYLAGYGVA